MCVDHGQMSQVWYHIPKTAVYLGINFQNNCQNVNCCTKLGRASNYYQLFVFLCYSEWTREKLSVKTLWKGSWLPPPPPRYSDLGFAFEILSTFAAKKRLTSSDQILQGSNFSSSRRQGFPKAKIHVRNTGNIFCKERLTSSEQLLRFLLDAWNLIPLDFMLYNSPEISKLFCNYDFFFVCLVRKNEFEYFVKSLL